MFENEMLGIDSTGYSTEYHSHYYDKRVKEFGLIKKRIYMKSTIITELKLQIIVSFKLELNFRHDSLDFPKALKNVPKFIIKKSKYIIGDKGYDSEYNHECARSYGLISVIPARYEEVPVYRTKGYYRKKMKKGLPKEYKQRTKIETVHYVIKRKFGDSIRSMNKINSRKEVIML
jgi:hypothetical protein